jgi:ribosomal-protein-alanine N-acetyltransferase
MIHEEQRFLLESLAAKHAAPLSRYYAENRQHLAPWEPARPEGYHAEEAWRQRIVEFEHEAAAGSSVRFVAVERDGVEIIATCNFSNIVRGAFQACHLGYSIAEKHQGVGLMTEVLAVAIKHVFDELGLHRIMANYMPENAASARVLEKLGFEQEGYAKSYLLIAGQWRDHVLTAKLNPTAT